MVLAVVLAVVTGCRPEIQSFSLTGRWITPRRSWDAASASPRRSIAKSSGCSATPCSPLPGVTGPGSATRRRLWGRLESITAVTEPVDGCGAPFALVSPGVPTTPTGAGPAFWPSSIVPTADGRAAVWYDRMLIDGDTWTRQATWVDEMEPGATTLDRTNETVLFGTGRAELLDRATSSTTGSSTSTRRCWTPICGRRTPWPTYQASYRERAEYTYWDGAGWTRTSTLATRIVLGGAGNEASGGLGGMTVSYNPWLGKYLIVHGEAWKQDLMLPGRVAARGAMVEPTHVDVPDSTADNPFSAYTGPRAPEFRSADGRTIELTYIRSTGWLQSQLPAVRVTFK